MFPPIRLASARSNLRTLLGWTLGLSVLVLALLELWRPCYFLTDDNLSGYFPVVTEVGRHLKAGQSPFYYDYIFGGHYNGLRDIEYVVWHPLIFAVSLLADTPAQFWMIDLESWVLLLITVTGFTVLAHHLRDEFSVPIPDAYLVFYTLSFVFCTYILTIGPSWIGFLVTQGCLPWLILGILDRKLLRGTFLVTIFTMHEMLGGYSGLFVSGGLTLSAFALVVALNRRSIQPLFMWGVGNLLALLILMPLWIYILDGFAHSHRIQGMALADLSAFSIPPAMFLSSFFLGNWCELLARSVGDVSLSSIPFPYVATIMACPAAWCLVPAIGAGGRWRYLDKLCLGLALVLALLIVRPYALAVIMHQLPILRSMRWPFREGLLFLFFVHLLLVLRFPEKPPRWQTATAVFSLLVFLLPLPFSRVPTLNPLALDRQLLFSGHAAAFWSKVKLTLQPTDEIVTVIDLKFWNRNRQDIPYTLLGAANFPSYFQVRCISGYSTTAPVDQVPLTTVPFYWFGAFREEQVGEILAQHPGLKIVRIVSTHPLRITMSTGDGPPVDLSPDLPQ